jgi:hypothetical protein
VYFKAPVSWPNGGILPKLEWQRRSRDTYANALQQTCTKKITRVYRCGKRLMKGDIEERINDLCTKQAQK